MLGMRKTDKGHTTEKKKEKKKLKDNCECFKQEFYL